MAKEEKRDDDRPLPATNTGEDQHSRTGNNIGRGGDTLVQDDVTMGRPLEGEEPPDVDRRAP